ncbi:MAG: GNAT family N-acetyltransferase [Actinomycetia bacterium]|nr:GNAT family N-acetyltransferase [Actinomycetes bacterium]
MHFEDLDAANQHEVRRLILTGLGDHWGSIDESLNPDLDDMLSIYALGRTVVVRSEQGSVVGTGTLFPWTDEKGSTDAAMIVRMSVARDLQRSGVGRRIVEELMATARSWGKSRVVLETTSGWTEVINFYLACGFEITHEADSEYGNDTWFERATGLPDG